MSYQVIHGDCIEEMAKLGEASVDAIVTDPPYELSFMGKAWDATGVAYQPETWQAALRVLKPGGHLLAFGGTRTYHRLACAIEDAGFEIRDSVMWLYGSGFPKSLDVSKAIDKAAGAEREVVGISPHSANREAGAIWGGTDAEPERNLTTPATPEAAEWEGWGTALKPAHEPIVVARKPLIGTVAANVLEHGTGALNIDGTRVGYQGAADQASAKPGGRATAKAGALAGGTQNDNGRSEFEADNTKGRWPPNVVLDEEAAAELDAQTGELTSGDLKPYANASDAEYRQFHSTQRDVSRPGDSGGASRFFYCAKTSRAERNAGLEGFEEKPRRGDAKNSTPRSEQIYEAKGALGGPRANHHPTVKPINLMRWLARLVTPPNGLVLDPFLGSGTTGCAAVLEDFDFIGIEREAEYVAIAEARIKHWYAEPVQLGLEAA